MKIILAIFIIIMAPITLRAECPTGFEEIQMENITMTESGAQCGAGTDAYYNIDDLCSANIQ